MADAFTLQLNETLSRKAFARLKNNAPYAIVRALNRSADSGKVTMVREMSRDVGLKVSDVRDQVTVSPAHTQRLAAQIMTTGKRIALEKFGAKGAIPSRGRGNGVSYKIGSIRKSLPNAFRARMPSGHIGVFERTPGKFMRSNPRRQAIHEKFGPSLPHVFRKFRAVGLARMKEQLIKNLRHEFRFAALKQQAS